MKPERIQMGLRNLPGWQHDKESASLVRLLQFPARRVAAKYSSFLAELAEAHGLFPRIELQGDTVLVAVPGGPEGIDETTFTKAGQLSVSA